jgi:hypothetical protein
VVVQSREREGRGRKAKGDSTEGVKCERLRLSDRPTRPDALFFIYFIIITRISPHIPSHPDQTTPSAPSYRSIFAAILYPIHVCINTLSLTLFYTYIIKGKMVWTRDILKHE